MFIRLRQLSNNPLLCLAISSWWLLLLILLNGFCPSGLNVLIGVVLLFSGIFYLCFFLFELPDVYSHYKEGVLYEEMFSGKVTLAESDMSQQVVYRKLGESSRGTADYWVRPYKSFHDTVKDKTGKNVCRFKRLK